MKKNPASQSGLFNPRAFLAFALCSVGLCLAMLSFATTPPRAMKGSQVNAPDDPRFVDSSVGRFSAKALAATAANTPFSSVGPRTPFAPQAPSMPLASTGTSDWSVVTSANIAEAETDNFLNAMTCVSASDCWAVGYYWNSHANQTLIVHWDGTAWTVVPSPNALATQTNILTDVTCVSASDCWAVGAYYNGSVNRTLVQRWDGTSWTIVSSPNSVDPQTGDLLADVTCASTSDCWAVGYSFVSGSLYQTLIEHWDGTTWTIVSSPNSLATQSNFLTGVTCPSASDCWAVGYAYNVVNIQQTLILRWNGTLWTVVASPNTSALQTNILTEVTCTSASDCWAVGRYFSNDANQTLIERWDGTAWTIVTSPNTSTAEDNLLHDVTCASASDCWAVGYVFVGGRRQTLIERWNGTIWTIAPSPSTSATQTNFFNAVTCVSASNCWAVGVYSNFNQSNLQKTPRLQTLLQRWDGTSWSIVISPNALTTLTWNFLTDTTCASASDCWAVGYYYNGGVNQTLIQHWDGNSWSIVPSPNTSATQGNFLNDVTCLSGSDCWAVGSYRTLYVPGGSPSEIFQTLIQRWDGTSWKIVSSPNTSAASNFLRGMTCVSASDCWAVGAYHNGSVNQSLIQHWDGTSWTIVPSLNTSTTQPNALNDVTCVSGSDCWAVGSFGSTFNEQTLIQRWDGTSWTIVPSPNTSTTERNGFSDVTCASASDCWAVGSVIASNVSQTLIAHWDGSSWAIVASPNSSATQHNSLNGVTCASPSDCWAVGGHQFDPVTHTLIVRWDGSSWTIVDSPNSLATETNSLNSVTCASSSDCWAVGEFVAYFANNGVGQTLTIKYTANVPVPTSVVSQKTHGTAGTFDTNLPLAGNPGIECRSGGANKEYEVVFTFLGAITFSGATATPGPGGTGSISSTSSSPDGTEVTVNLSDVSNEQTLKITLSDVNDGTNSGDVSVSMGVLVGDVMANKIVSNTDVAEVKAQVSSPVTASNFRNDVNANGVISNTDVGETKANVSTALP